MGASQSGPKRSVSMENPNPVAGVLDISDDVVNRLKKSMKEVQKTVEAAEKKSQDQTPPPPKKEAPKASPAKPVAPTATPKIVYQNPTPIVVSPNATLTATDVRRQMEVELQKNDAAWRERMSSLQENLKKTDAIMEEEYNTAVQNVRSRFANAPPTYQLPPCQDLKAQLLACYRAHPGETLLCSEEVMMFRNCVNAHRLMKLEKNDENSSTKVAKAG